VRDPFHQTAIAHEDIGEVVNDVVIRAVKLRRQHLTGYDLPIEELKNFRQLHSKTPGHPEIGYTPGGHRP
jgi:transketolase N-terminal domain/subunit